MKRLFQYEKRLECQIAEKLLDEVALQRSFHAKTLCAFDWNDCYMKLLRHHGETCSAGTPGETARRDR